MIRQRSILLKVVTMSPSTQKQVKGELLPRLLADGVLTHMAAVIALGVPILLDAIAGDGASAVALAEASVSYYLKGFLPLSSLFPLAYLANGFYTGGLGYSGPRKPLALVRGLLTGGTFFILASCLVPFRIPASSNLAALCMAVLAAAALPRIVKAAVVKYSSIEPKHARASRADRVVLVQGGAGYIGSIVVRRLLNAGYRVRVLDSLIYGDAALRDVMDHPRLELQVGDCRNIKSVITAVNGVDSIIHLAAIVGDPACDLDHSTTLEINYAATRMLIEVAKGQGVKRLIFASSCSVYGATDELMDETSETVPLSLYAQTKIDCEKALLEASDDLFHPTIVRLATVFGNSPRPRFDLVVNLLTAKAHAEGAIIVYNGNQWRPFIHVTDVARGLIAMLEAPSHLVKGQIFNLGDSKLNHTLNDVAQRIHNTYPNTVIHQIDNTDRRNYRVSFEKVQTVLRFECEVTLDSGIRELKEVLEAGAIEDYKDERYHNQRFLQAQGSPATPAIDKKVMAAFAGSCSRTEPSLTHA